MDEPNIPEWVTAKLDVVLPVLHEFFPVDSLMMGGGTVLQARWCHRVSTDIDLFTSTTIFNSVIGASSVRLESALYEIPEVNRERSWVETNVVYCEVEGVELTVMPSDSLVSEESARVIHGTTIKTESTSTILNKKLVGRMIQGDAFEIRDLFDLYIAIQKDPRALRAAIRPIPPRSMDSIESMLLSLPSTWFEDTTKPLLGVENPPSSDDMIENLIQEFDRQLGRDERDSR